MSITPFTSPRRQPRGPWRTRARQLRHTSSGAGLWVLGGFVVAVALVVVASWSR